MAGFHPKGPATGKYKLHRKVGSQKRKERKCFREKTLVIQRPKGKARPWWVIFGLRV